MKEKIKLAIVDDSIAYRKFLETYLKSIKDFEIIISCSNGQELLENAQYKTLHVVLSDIKMPIMDGLKITEHLSVYCPEIKIILLTAYNDTVDFSDLIHKGANGFLPKETISNQIVDAIYTVANQLNYFVGKDLKKLIIPKAGKNELISALNLSNRELEIIDLLCNGSSTKEIAVKLNISSRTIETHRNNLYQKTGTKGIGDLAAYATHYGLIKYNGKGY